MADIDLKRLQQIELDILIDVDRICKKHNLDYFLCSGTLLGAIRHKGFIPWDDDIDICMPIKDYFKFCKIAPKELSDEHFLQCYKTDAYDFWFAKVRKNNTTCIEAGRENSKTHNGVWIDIFPLIGIKNDERWIAKLQRRASFLRKLIKKKYGSMNGSFLDLSFEKKILRFIPLSVVRHFVHSSFKLILKSHKKYDDCYYLWGDPNIKARFKSNLFDEYIPIEFENHDFSAPKKWDEYLTIVYGDYMTPPPIEKRNGGSHTIALLDLDKDYSEYINS